LIKALNKIKNFLKYQENVKGAINEFGLHGMTVTQVIGCGLQKGRTEFYRDTEYSINLLPKIKLEIRMWRQF